MSGIFGGGGDNGVAGGLSNGVKLAAVALLVQQLLKHSQSGDAHPGNARTAEVPAHQDAAPTGGGGLGGGLGGLLGGLLGGGAGSAMAGGGLSGILGSLLGGGSRAPGGLGGGLGGLAGAGGLGGLLGGLGGLLGSMRQQGLGQQVDSWISPDANHPITARDLERSFDPNDLDEAARHAGTDRSGLLDELSRMLPQLVDRATPQGGLPRREEDLGTGGLSGLLSGLVGGSAARR